GGGDVAHRRELLRLYALVRALVDQRLESLVLASKLLVEEPHLEQVPDAQEQLGRVEGLGHEVARAGGEGAPLGLGRRVRGEDEDRQIGLRRRLLLEPREDLEAADVRHPEIEENQIRLERRVAR